MAHANSPSTAAKARFPCGILADRPSAAIDRLLPLRRLTPCSKHPNPKIAEQLNVLPGPWEAYSDALLGDLASQSSSMCHRRP